MMESNFRRRTPGDKLGSIAAKGSLSPKGTIKKKKQDRKMREQQEQEIRSLNVQIGRLEDRDTQQQAFAKLIESLPDLNPSLVKEVYSLIEKNKKPGRSSTRRMLVLLIAALCKCHPVQTAKILPRILTYICIRLRDGHSKTTDACVILVSAIALYVLPCSSISLPAVHFGSPRRRRGTQQAFEAVAAVLTQEANVVGEAATKSICGLLHPVDFDGVSVPGPGTIDAHAKRIRSFFQTLLADTVEKMDGSTQFTSFSPLFLLLQSACLLAKNAYEKASFTALGDDFAPHIASIYEAIEDAFQCGPREDWMLRKRGLELLTMILDTFVLQDERWCTAVGAAQQFFQTHLEKLRVLVLAGRHDSVSLVREATIPAGLAFECLEKQWPQTANVDHSNIARTNYDFVAPNPPGYTFRNKRWVKPVVNSSNDLAVSGNSSSQSLPLIPDAVEDEAEPGFNDEAGDEAEPTHDIPVEDDKPPVETAEDDKTFEVEMDRADVPEDKNDEELRQQDEVAPPFTNTKNRKPSARQTRSFLPTAEPQSTPLAAATSVHSLSTLQQFVSRQRAKARSRNTYENAPNISLPKRRPSRAIQEPALDDYVDRFQANHLVKEEDGHVIKDETTSDDEATFTRAEATLEAARCGEHELAFRLCILEDDLELMRRTMSIIETPCLSALSTAARSALCAAFLTFLDDTTGSSSDVWLALKWLQHWAAANQPQLEQLDPRVGHALLDKLREIATTPTKAALIAAHVLFLLRM